MQISLEVTGKNFSEKIKNTIKSSEIAMKKCVFKSDKTDFKKAVPYGFQNDSRIDGACAI